MSNFFGNSTNVGIDTSIINTVKITSNELVISDNCIILGSDNPSDNLTSAVSHEYFNGGKKWAGLARDKSTHQFYLYKDATSEITGTTDLTALSQASLQCSSITLSSALSAGTLAAPSALINSIDTQTTDTLIMGNASITTHIDLKKSTDLTGSLNVVSTGSIIPNMGNSIIPSPFIITASASSASSYHAFDSDDSNYWEGAPASYVAGIYKSSSHLREYYGEWLKIYVGTVARTVIGYSILPVASYEPVSYVLIGSNDNSVWYRLDHRRNTQADGVRIDLEKTASYLYYALVFTKLVVGATSVRIKKIKLFGPSINSYDLVSTNQITNSIKLNTISQKDNGSTLSLTAPIDNVSMNAITHGLTVVNNGYFGACYDPINNYIIFAPHADYTGVTGYVYYDCNDQTYKRSNIPSFIGAMVTTAYIQACYHPGLRRIYFGPFSQNAQTYWHYWNCDTATFVDYAHGLSTATFSGCAGIIYSPVNECVYIIPFGMCNRAQWIKINSVGTASLYTHGLGTGLAVNSYNGGVYDPENNRIYLAPYVRATDATWHYINCATDLAVAYTHGKGAFFTANDFTFGCYNPDRKTVHWNQFGASDLGSWYYLDPTDNLMYAMVQETPISGNYAYNGEMVYAPNQKRIYPIPSGDADYAYLHFINCVDNTVQVVNNPITAVNDAYSGGAYSPIEGRIIMSPLGQSDETNYHVIECLTNPTTALNINYDNTITIPKAELIAYNFYMPMGESIITDSITATVVALANTWYKVLGTTVAGFQHGFTTSTPNRLTYTESRFKSHAHIGCTFSAKPTANNDDVQFSIYKNGTIIAGSKLSLFLGSTAQFRSTALHCMDHLSNNDYLELWVRNNTGGNNIIVDQMNLFAIASPSGS